MIGVPPRLADDGITLRLWEVGDEVALSRAWQDPEIARWAQVPAVTGRRAAEQWIDGCARRARSGVAVDLAVVDSAGTVVGEVGLHGFDRRRRAAEIGYWVHEPARGRGVAASAIGLLCGWALGPERLDAVVARCHPDNHGSIAAALAAGFSPLGVHEDMSVFARRREGARANGAIGASRPRGRC